MNAPKNVAKGEHEIQEDNVYRTIKKHLEKKPEGKRIIKTFESDRQRNSVVLINYLRDELSKDDALTEKIVKAHGNISKTEIKTIINGGEIGQIINIGQLDRLTIRKKFSPFRDVKQLLVFLGIFLLTVGVIYTTYWYSIQPRKMNGDFNIAIAQFGEITDDGIKPTALSTKIGDSLLSYLESEFKASNFGLTVDVSNQNMPLITEEASARKLADRTGATIVIYGNVYVQGEEAKLSPHFYVSQEFDASELTGEAELAEPIIFSLATIEDRDQVEQDLKLRSAILVNFTYSLIYLADQNFVDAIVFAQEAIKEAEASADSLNGEENLYLVAARIETVQKNYDNANRLLDQALVINPNYARAYIARGNIYYGQATRVDPIDNSLLEDALVEYQLAYEAQDQPLGANIPVKAHVSIGNINLLQAQIASDGTNLYANAIEHYRFVIEQYERSHQTSIQELAAQSYFSMGFAYERIGNLQDAIQAYERALTTTSDLDFEKTVKNQLVTTKELFDVP